MAPKSFADFPLDPRLVAALADEGITHPFPIQELTLPLALHGADVIGQARTGTGKTLAFGLAVLQRVDPEADHTQALIVVPTRELCLQVTEDLRIGATRGVSVVSVYGGVGYDKQIEALTTGVHVVVGTPGRLLDHLNKGNLDLSRAKLLVLDEADEMLDMGFLPDVERLIDATQEQGRHTLLFSATMPREVVSLARRYMTHPTFMRADTEEHEVAPNVEQYFFQVHRMDKPRILARVLQSSGRGGCYVFVRTKAMADRLVRELDELGVEAVALHGDLRQATREKHMDIFRDGKADVLVATEVAARGLDVENITHVVNYDCPDDEKMYLHRIGRTARAGAAGVAITFAEFNEVERLNVIRKAVDADRGIDEVFSTSPLLRELFDLPERTPWDRFSSDDDSQASGRRQRSSRPSEREASGRTRQDRGGRSSSKGRDGSSGQRSSGRKPAARRDDHRTANDADTDTRPTREPVAEVIAEAREETAPEVARTRTRTRARTRSDDGASADRGSSGNGQTSARARSATQSESPEKRPRARARSGRSGASSEASSDDAPSSDRGSRTTRGESSSSSRSSSRSSRGGASRSSGGRSSSRSSRGGSTRSSGTTSRSSSHREATGTTPPRAATSAERITDRGEDARGDGVPRLDRHLQIEHLP